MKNRIRKILLRFPRLRNAINTSILYIKYPYNIIRGVKIVIHYPIAKTLGIKFLAPNFIFMDKLDSKSTVVDVGCGFEADFSVAMINHYQLKAFGIDPTKKHQEKLRQIEEQHKGHFTHLRYAISQVEGKITFRESAEHESGSMLTDHVNVLNDTIIEYEVDSITLNQIPLKAGVHPIDILKLDIEGVEYELFNHITTEDLAAFQQLFVEFHHRSIRRFSRKDTRRIVKKIQTLGFKAITLDGDNYLFYR
jgi:FkbM family methyltransferase